MSAAEDARTRRAEEQREWDAQIRAMHRSLIRLNVKLRPLPQGDEFAAWFAMEADA